jgi:hypothetical protein
MTGNIILLFASIIFLSGAVRSVKNGAVQFKSGYQLRRSADPLGFWAIVIILGGGGFFFSGYAAFQLMRLVTNH